jgi:hypothetical protein
VVVRSGLRLTVANEIGVVDDDALHDLLIPVAEHAEAAEVRLVGRDLRALEPGTVGELIEVVARRAGGIEVRAVERALSGERGRCEEAQDGGEMTHHGQPSGGICRCLEPARTAESTQSTARRHT